MRYSRGSETYKGKKVITVKVVTLSLEKGEDVVDGKGSTGERKRKYSTEHYSSMFAEES